MLIINGTEICYMVGWDSVNASSAKPQTAVAFAPLVWGYGRLCLAEALTLNQRIIFNRTARNNSTGTGKPISLLSLSSNRIYG
jgi:hypothetical protein